VRVSGKDSGRISIAGLLAYRRGYRGHFYYRLVVHRGRRGERRSLSEADYAALLSAAHQQLHAPIILIWDNYHRRRGRQLLDGCLDPDGWGVDQLGQHPRIAAVAAPKQPQCQHEVDNSRAGSSRRRTSRVSVASTTSSTNPGGNVFVNAPTVTLSGNHPSGDTPSAPSYLTQ